MSSALLPDDADVIVIGAGITGACIAAHLAAAGRAPLVIDRLSPAHGTTVAGAGMAAQWAAQLNPFDPFESELERYGLEYYRELGRSADIDLLESGTLYVARDAEEHDLWLAPLMSAEVPVPRECLDASGVGRVAPLLDARHVFSGIFYPGAIQLTTIKATEVLLGRATTEGATVITGVDVTALDANDGPRVHTSGGTITAQAVVIASGAWSNQLLEPLEYWAPYVPLVASRIVSEQIGADSRHPGVHFLGTHGIYVRPLHGRLSWGCVYETDPRYRYVSGDLAAGPLPIDPDAGVQDLLAAAQLVRQALPALAETGADRVYQGLPCHTPDGRPLVGALPGAPEIVLAAGDNYAGVTNGPGLGRLVADLVCGRQPFVDPGPLAPERFGSAYANSADILAQPLFSR
jgi:sarcosine oxidase subunit beta